MGVFDVRVGEEKLCTYCGGKGYRLIGTVIKGIITNEKKLHCDHCNGQGKWTWWNPPPWDKRR